MGFPEVGGLTLPGAGCTYSKRYGPLQGGCWSTPGLSRGQVQSEPCQASQQCKKNKGRRIIGSPKLNLLSISKYKRKGAVTCIISHLRAACCYKSVMMHKFSAGE